MRSQLGYGDTLDKAVAVGGGVFGGGVGDPSMGGSGEPNGTHSVTCRAGGTGPAYQHCRCSGRCKKERAALSLLLQRTR